MLHAVHCGCIVLKDRVAPKLYPVHAACRKQNKNFKNCKNERRFCRWKVNVVTTIHPPVLRQLQKYRETVLSLESECCHYNTLSSLRADAKAERETVLSLESGCCHDSTPSCPRATVKNTVIAAMRPLQPQICACVSKR